MKIERRNRDEAFNRLHDLLKPGDTVYTVTRHVSASGRTRSVDVFIFRGDKPQGLTWEVRQLLGEPFDRKHGGVKVADNEASIVYRLGRELWPDRVHALKHQIL